MPDVSLIAPSSLDVHQHIVELLNPVEDANILDVGCGQGATIQALLPHIPHGHIIGVDRSWSSMNRLSEIFNNELSQGILELAEADFSVGLGFPNQAYDDVICHNVMEWIVSPVRLMQHIHRVLTIDGKAIIGHVDYATLHYESNYPEITNALVENFCKNRMEWARTANYHVTEQLAKVVESSPFTTYKYFEHIDTDKEFARGSYSSIFAEGLIFLAGRHHILSDEELLLWKEDLDHLAAAGNFRFELTSRLYLVQRVA